MEVFVQAYLAPLPLLAPLSTIIRLIRICVQHWSLFLFLSRTACSSCQANTLTACVSTEWCHWAINAGAWQTGGWCQLDFNLLWAQISAEMEERGGQKWQIGSRRAVSRRVTERFVCVCVCYWQKEIETMGMYVKLVWIQVMCDEFTSIFLMPGIVLEWITQPSSEIICLSCVSFDIDIVYVYVCVFVMCLCCRLGLSCLVWHITC